MTLQSNQFCYFDLYCDRSSSFSNGPSNERLVAWDQSVRYLPIEARVSRGQRIPVSAQHDFEAVRVGLPELHPFMTANMVGHAELLSPTGPPQPVSNT